MNLRLKIDRCVPKWQQQIAREAFAAAEQLSPSRHEIFARVVPHSGVTMGGMGERGGFGVTVIGRTLKPSVQICIAAGICAVVKQHGGSRREAIGALRETILHEWAHYEQYRDRKPIIERGVRVRSRHLMVLAGWMPQ